MSKIEKIINQNLIYSKKIKDIAISNNTFLLEETIKYLNSEEALKSIEQDPYWPKWSTPWWRILILYEMDLLELIPKKILLKMEEKINTHYIKFFPFTEEEIPQGIDPRMQIMCHCQIGSIYKIFDKINSAKNIQWARKWFIKYQLEDGGLNCDESVYTKKEPKSSLVSTLPCLEAMLYIEDLNQEEKNFIDKGARYLIEKRIFRKSNGDIINKNWLTPFFPRFYEFDILRALSFLTKWAKITKNTLPIDAILETLEILNDRIDKNALMESGELYFINENKKNPDTFPLLKYFIDLKNGNIYLSKEWYKNIDGLDYLLKNNLLS